MSKKIKKTTKKAVKKDAKLNFDELFEVFKFCTENEPDCLALRYDKGDKQKDLGVYCSFSEASLYVKNIEQAKKLLEANQLLENIKKIK